MTRKECIAGLEEMLAGSRELQAAMPVEVETAKIMRRDQTVLQEAIRYLTKADRNYSKEIFV